VSDNLIERIAKAWLHHQGYSDNVIDALRTVNHESYGCEFCPNHQAWDCTDENGHSRHPVWDAIIEAGEIANVVVEILGLTEERRVVTPQGTSREVRPGEVLGDRLRSLGWQISTRWLTGWERTDG
jgi:hypothetical protein